MIPRCYVFLDDPSALATRLAEVAQIVARTLGRSYPDVLPLVRYGRGILVRDANPAQARLVGRALARVGLGVFSVPEGDLEAPPRRAKRISRVEADEDGLRLTIRGFEQIPPVRLEWSEVWTLAPHALLLGSPSEERAGLPRRGETMAALSPQASQLLSDLRHSSELDRRPIQLCLDVLADGSNLYRIHHDDVGVYAGLEVRSEHAVENFLSMCTSLVDLAPTEVLIPSAVRRFLQTGQVESILFAKREALDSALLWLVQARAFGVRFDDEAEDLDDDELTEEDEAILVDAEGEDAEDLEDADLDYDSRDDFDDEEDALVEGAEGVAVGSSIGAGRRGRAAAEAPAAEEADHDEADHDGADLDEADLDDSDLGEADGDVVAALEHFEQTSRLDQAAIEAMLTQSRDLEDEEEEDEEVEVDVDVQNALGLFDANSGPINVRQLLRSEEENTAGE